MLNTALRCMRDEGKTCAKLAKLQVVEFSEKIECKSKVSRRPVLKLLKLSKVQKRLAVARRKGSHSFRGAGDPTLT